MKNVIVLLIASIVGSSAMASGFVCQTEKNKTNIRIYNEVNPAKGTRNGSVMVFSDPTVSEGRKTIAVFKRAKKTLRGSSYWYYGKVDLRTTELKKGEYLLGTRLGALSFVAVMLNFSDSRPVKHGAPVIGILIAKKRNGQTIRDNVNCRRYLKGN